jgi:hypothetical protein
VLVARDPEEGAQRAVGGATTRATGLPAPAGGGVRVVVVVVVVVVVMMIILM